MKATLYPNNCDAVKWYNFCYIVICSIFLEKEKADKTFGFSFVSLMRADGTTVPDDTHDLCVYKVK